MTARRSLWIVVLVMAAAVASPAAAQADPNKVLRVAFPVAETGFDPQAANDLYSNHVNRAIFDTAYTYDYLARPFKLVPNTAVALPQISADGLVWTFRIKPGIYFNDDPAFKGQKRELTAADYVYSWKRVLDPKLRSPHLQVFDDLFEGADAAIAKAKETGKFDYDAPMEGLLAVDRYTIRLKLKRPSYDLLSNLTQVLAAAVAREVIEAYGDPSGWAMQNPVGTGPYRLKDWRRGQKIVLEANPGFRDVTFPDSKDPADREIVARNEGREAAAHRAHRNHDHRGVAAAPAGVRKGRPRLRHGPGRPGLERDEQGQQAAAALRRRGRDAGARRPARDHVHLLQHGGSGRRRLHEGQGRAAPRDRHGLQRRRGNPRAPPGAGDAGHAGDPARRDRLRPKFLRARQIRPRGGEGAAGQVRLHRPRQGRLARPARRQAAGAEDGRPPHRRSTGSTTNCGSATFPPWESASNSSPRSSPTC